MTTGDAPMPPPLAEQPPTALTNEEKMWAMLCHLSVLLAKLALYMTFLGPLICWLMKKDTSKFVDYHGKESLNFQINILVYSLVCLALIPCFFIGVFLFPVVFVYNLVLVIIAGIKAHNGEMFSYPFIFRLIK